MVEALLVMTLDAMRDRQKPVRQRPVPSRSRWGRGRRRLEPAEELGISEVPLGPEVFRRDHEPERPRLLLMIEQPGDGGTQVGQLLFEPGNPCGRDVSTP